MIVNQRIQILLNNVLKKMDTEDTDTVYLDYYWVSALIGWAQISYSSGMKN